MKTQIVQSANDPAGLLKLEPDMEILDKRSTEVFFLAKQLMQKGEYGSIILEHDSIQVSKYSSFKFIL